MINHYTNIREVEKSYKDLMKYYELFSKKEKLEERNILLNKIKIHREAITKLNTSLKNIYFK